MAVAEARPVERTLTGTRPGKALAGRFVAGDTLDEGVAAARKLNGDGFLVSLDLLGEECHDRATAIGARDEYVEGLDRIGAENLEANISIKLTQLGLAFDESLAIALLDSLADRAADVGTTVTIDMEDSRYTEATVRIYEKIQSAQGNLGIALQAYLHRTPSDLKRLMPLGGHIRLCKGAYVEDREVALTSRRDVDEAFASQLRDLMGFDEVHPAVATHDSALVDLTRELARLEEDAIRVSDALRDPHRIAARFDRSRVPGSDLPALWLQVVSLPDPPSIRTAFQRLVLRPICLRGPTLRSRPMALTEERQEQSAPEKRRPDASQVLEGLGILLGLGTVALGLLGTIPDHPDFEVGREVFGNIPASLQVVFYVSVAGFVWLMFHLFARRAAGWSLGATDRRTGLWGQRIKGLGGGLLMKTLMRDPRAGLTHAALYYGFLVLFLGTVILEIDHILPSNLQFLHGRRLSGLFGRAGPRLPRLPRRRGVVRDQSLSGEAGPDQDQDQARGRPDPLPPRRHGSDRPPHRVGSNRPRRPARLRGVVLCRISAFRPVRAGSGGRRSIRRSGSSTWPPSSGSSSSFPSPSSVTCSPRRPTCSSRPAPVPKGR